MYLHEMRPHQLEAALRERWPLLLPAGCVENHGPHLPLGVDTWVAQVLCERLAERVPCVVAPPFYYGPTGYAVSGPDRGTMDVSTDSFARHAKDVLAALCDLGFHRIYVVIHHQGMDGPEALAFRRAAAELSLERPLRERGPGWWGAERPTGVEDPFGRIRVRPTILPGATGAGGDHAGLYETAYMLHIRPDLVEMDRLQGDLPWFCVTEGDRADAATAEQGRQMFEAMVEAWVAELRSP